MPVRVGSSEGLGLIARSHSNKYVSDKRGVSFGEGQAVVFLNTSLDLRNVLIVTEVLE